MVIYVAILGMVSIFVVNTILIIIKSFNGFRASSDLNTNGEIAMERMVREIRLADSIGAGSVFDSHPGHLILNTIDPNTELATTIEFFASTTALMIKEGSQGAIALTSENVELVNLVFREVATSTDLKSKAVKIEMEIRSKRPNFPKAAKFYSTIVLRRSY